MADVIGPNSYLPGDFMGRKIPRGTVCDTHPDRLAVAEIVGETDSMGSETYYCCQECVTESRNAPPSVGTCDWCKTPKQVLNDRRDYEEGLCGRVYQICGHCLKQDQDRINRELADDGWFDDYNDYDPDD